MARDPICPAWEQPVDYLETGALRVQVTHQTGFMFRMIEDFTMHPDCADNHAIQLRREKKESP